MKKVIVLLMSLIVSLLATVAEASVNQCETVKRVQIEAPCIDVGFDQTIVQYDAYLVAPPGVEQTAVQKHDTILSYGSGQKIKKEQRYLKKSGTARICSLETIHYTN